CVHHLSDKQDHVLNLFTELEKTGKLDLLFLFASTSKISYPGAGVAVMVCSDANITWAKKIMGVQAIGPDKINQLRHVRFFGNSEGVLNHMRRHADILAPKFDAVLETLERRIGGTGAGTWHKPAGGYFVSFDAMPGCATRIYELCKEAGLVITGAGATFPYGKDERDSNLRIAPSYPKTEELQVAMELFCTCALLAACQKRMTEAV
ncbi:MAG: aminotransferase, partial [Clostridia bacterium]|nr:aminotransferase [Clostridia bacterium]